MWRDQRRKRRRRFFISVGGRPQIGGVDQSHTFIGTQMIQERQQQVHINLPKNKGRESKRSRATCETTAPNRRQVVALVHYDAELTFVRVDQEHKETTALTVQLSPRGEV